MHKSNFDRDERATFLPGAAALSSQSAASAGSVVIPFPLERTAAALALEDEASVSEDLPPSIGTLAVRLVTEWNEVRIRVFGVEQVSD